MSEPIKPMSAEYAGKFDLARHEREETNHQDKTVWSEILLAYAEQLEYVAKCTEGEECSLCEGTGIGILCGHCPSCNGSGRIPEHCRVTMAFEDDGWEAPPDESSPTECIGIVACKMAVFSRDRRNTMGSVSKNTAPLRRDRTLPIRIGVTVEVQKVCLYCFGEDAEFDDENPPSDGAYKDCDECKGKGILPTPYTLHFDKEPWCGTIAVMGSELEHEAKEGVAEISFDAYSADTTVASYEATVRKVEVPGCPAISPK